MALEHQEYTQTAVPKEQRRSGWHIFFIVTGTMCGLPTFVLSARIINALGIINGSLAIFIGAAVIATLASATSFLGSASGLSHALLSERAFGQTGAGLVRVLLATSLIGWYGANIGLLGDTAEHALSDQFHLTISSPLISSGLGILIMLAALRGIGGLERIGMIVIPASIIGILIAIFHVWHDLPRLSSVAPTKEMNIGEALSSIIGSYIVGIIIQPDYSRFVRVPYHAVAAILLSLIVVYPLMMLGAAIPAAVEHKANLIAVLTALGFGAPALVILFLGTWIDASACLYSGSLSVAKQINIRRITPCIIGCGLCGICINFLGIYGLYLRFLLLLGVGLPPIAAILIVEGFLGRENQMKLPRWRPWSLIAWFLGVAAGSMCSLGSASLTFIPTFDAIVVSTAVALIGVLVKR